jgi:transaldolase/glucose-6-phosphate isomerase
MNPAKLLAEQGQSLWYDNIRRSLLEGGGLARLTREAGIVGVTSNPTIFERAIAASTDYDEALERLAAHGRTAREIYDLLTIEDIRSAADILRPVYEATGARDGYVSIEVSPDLAHDTAGSIAQAHSLWDRIGRPNVMVKVPGTPEGVPAIRDLIAAGVNVNVTLLFSMSQYEAVADAALAGLEARLERGEDLSRIASVASFFVSRIDTLVDRLLAERNGPTSLRHRAGIASSKLVYARYRQIVEGDRFERLARAGARPQRLLWASTSTKNPSLRDTLYVEELIGPDTVNTVPEVTLRAFLDHGHVRPSLLEDVEGARAHVAALGRLGIDLEDVGATLQREGVASFFKSFEDLLRCIERRRQAILAHGPGRRRVALGPLEEAVGARVEALARADLLSRLWQKDPTLWKSDAAHEKVVKNRLGWLTSVEAMRAADDEIREFAEAARRDGFRHAILCGMGGSSLCPEVLARTFGTASGFLELRVLDSTVPDAVRAAEKGLDLGRTLVLLSSKSGTTIEVNAFYRHFAARLRPDQLVAITDPGTPLEKLARESGFRRAFLNPPDIGGRYSALSYFGLVPGALLGVDIDALLERAERMVEACASCVPLSQSPGAWLGAVLGEAALSGRDKVTFVSSPAVAPFGAWVEQLIAESTGKEGKGILPVDDEPLLPAKAYGKDRFFVGFGLAGEGNGIDAALAEIQRAGHPLVELRLGDRLDLGAEFFRWEVATAVAGAVLGVNPFDEPNVQESKDNTAALLAELERGGSLPVEAPTMQSAELRLYGGARQDTVGAALVAHLASVVPGDYVAFQVYLHRNDALHAELQKLRRLVAQGCGVATTLGYGPRFLHSTGQLHKGGPKRGVFVQVTGEAEDLEIPGERYGFATLVAAQALGDLRALREKGLRVVRLHATGDPVRALAGLLAEVERSLRLR